MLRRYYYQNNVFHFTELDHENDSNIFTIIVGRNGAGKSRLLSSIVREFLGVSSSKNFYSDLELGFDYNPHGQLEYKYLPAKIIVASTSPFDRFPISRNLEHIKGYSYLGIRDLRASNFGLAYISKIIGSLIEIANQDSKQMLEIAEVLKYLGYSDNIWIKLELRIASIFLKNIIESPDPLNAFAAFYKNPTTGPPYINRKFFYNSDRRINEKKVYLFINLLEKFINSKAKVPIQLQINKFGVRFTNSFNGTLEDLIFLFQSGIVRLEDAILERLDNKGSYPISHASSGEQSVIMGILGIASQIKDNSLVCIDEPEICLHPEWQERYIKLLTSTFNKYKGCHFLIATHSPQIISKLESNNCYILSMETGRALNAKHVINHSADFQLAHIFNAPGFKNEYLSRIALTIFTKVSRKKAFDLDDQQNYQLLLSQVEYLEKTDPVHDLILAIKEMYKMYA